MEQIFRFPVPLLFSTFVLSGVLFFAVGRIALHILSKHARVDARSIPQPAFVGTIATAWALSLGFVAADTWAVNGRADQAASVERSTIVRLLRSAEPDILNAPELMEAVTAYRKNVAIKEWLEGDNILPAQTVEAALHDIQGEIASLARGNAPSLLISQAMNDFSQLQEARNTRLAVGNTSIDFYKWYLVIFLTLLTAISIASTHADRVRAGTRALVIFATTASMSLWILAVHANPYIGLEELSPSALFRSPTLAEQVLESR